jgi:hypothetical protein
MLAQLKERCAHAREIKPLVLEMRRLRMQALQFQNALHLSKRLIFISIRRLKLQARLAGVQGEARLLGINLNVAKIDEAVEASQALVDA